MESRDMTKAAKPNYGEIVISFAIVSDELTSAAETWLLSKFPGFFRAEGYGACTLNNGDKSSERAMRYTIATGVKTNLIFAIVTDFAINYCKSGNQESIYFRTKDFRPYIITAQGKFLPVD